MWWTCQASQGFRLWFSMETAKMCLPSSFFWDFATLSTTVDLLWCDQLLRRKIGANGLAHFATRTRFTAVLSFSWTSNFPVIPKQKKHTPIVWTQFDWGPQGEINFLLRSISSELPNSRISCYLYVTSVLGHYFESQQEGQSLGQNFDLLWISINTWGCSKSSVYVPMLYLHRLMHYKWLTDKMAW